MIFPGYVPLIADFPMKLSDCMTLGYCDISTPFFSKKYFVKLSLEKPHI